MTAQSRKIAAFLFALSLLTSGCFKSRVKVFKLDTKDFTNKTDADKAKLLKEFKRHDGALYRLPRTVILATVPVKKTTKEPGAFEKFAPCFFTKAEADERTTSKSAEYAIQRVSFATTGEPDPDETYVVLTRGGFFESKSLLMDYTPDMRLKKGEAESKNEALEFASKAAKTAIGIAARAAMSGALRDTTSDPAKLADSRFMTAGRAKQCYDLIKSYQDNYLQEATAAVAEAVAELAAANAAVLAATTAAQTQLAQQGKEKAENKKKTADANKKQAVELKARADKDADEMSKALREESLRARAANSTKAPTNRGSGSTGGGTTSGAGGGATGSASPSPQLLDTGSLRNAAELAEAILTGGASTPSASDDKTLTALAASIPGARLTQLRDAVAAAKAHEATSHGRGKKARAAWDEKRSRLRGETAQALTEALNAALAGPMLYSSADLADVSLSAETLGLVAENPQGDRLVQLNRMLLEQTLTNYVRPRAPSAPDQSFTRRNLVDEYERAEQTFDQLEELLGRQNQLKSGNSNVPTDTYKLMLEKTDGAVGDYREAFLGKSSEEDWEGVFNFRPRKDVASQLSSVLFLFSPTAGICTQRGLIKEQGVRVSGKFVDADCATHDADQKDRVALWLRLDRKTSEDANLMSALDGLNKAYADGKEERGWYFRIPAVGTVVLKRGTLATASIDTLAGTALASIDATETAAKAREAGRGDMAVAQLGVIASVPASAAGRTTQSSVVLDEATGALLNFKVSSDALLQKTLIDDAKEASDSIIDAKDPLKRLQRENDLLDAKKNNRDKRKALEDSNSNSNSNSGNSNTP